MAIRDAFLQARRERHPVVLGIPFDLQERPWTGPENLPTPSKQLLPRLSPLPPHPDDVAKAAQLVDEKLINDGSLEELHPKIDLMVTRLLREAQR